MSETAIALILAAGKGTRMKSELPKVLHGIAGRSMLGRVFDTVRRAGLTEVHTIVGYGADAVKAAFPEMTSWVIQHEQRGTGDAVKSAREALAGKKGTVLLLSGDVPLLSSRTVSSFLEAHKQAGAKASLITVDLEDPAHYGRVIRNFDGSLAKIVEARDATPEERAVREINTGLYAFDIPALFKYVEELTPANDQNEYYLTDVFGMMVRDGLTVRPVKLPNPVEFMGINNRVELAEAERIVRERKVTELMLAGVTVQDPRTTYVDDAVEVGPDSILAPNVTLKGATKLGKKVEVRSGSVLRDTIVHDGAVIQEHCITDRAEIGPGASVGPFAHLRPKAKLGKNSKVGNFVEVKNSTLGEGTKASHLTYLGDATIGKNCNIGAGTITCNYDGIHKHETIIGDDVFVGSDSILVAPITLGDRSFVAAASNITRDVPAGALGIARARQANKEGYRALFDERHLATCEKCRDGGAKHKKD